MELMHDPGYGKTEVVPAHVKGGIEKAQGDPVEGATRAKTLGVASDRENRGQGHGGQGNGIGSAGELERPKTNVTILRQMILR